MTRIILFSVTAIALLQADQPGDANGVRAGASETPIVAARPRPKVEVVKMADFYLRDGNAVSGKLISDDGTQIVIEQLHDSVISTKTYSRREIDTRTLRKRPVPEWNYYTRLAEYFAARTWDFRDDPDDFIGAIRCYEKARESLQAGGANEERIAEIDRAIQKLKRDKDLTYLYITHDLSVAETICDKIAVMYLGKFVEIGDPSDIFKNPKHPYSQALVLSTPIADPLRKRGLLVLPGEVPSPSNPPPGCRFHPRCSRACKRFPYIVRQRYGPRARTCGSCYQGFSIAKRWILCCSRAYINRCYYYTGDILWAKPFL